MKHNYYIENLTCVNCGKILTTVLSGLKGVKQVSVKQLSKILSIDADFTVVQDEEIIEVIRSRRYTALRIINSDD